MPIYNDPYLIVQLKIFGKIVVILCNKKGQIVTNYEERVEIQLSNRYNRIEGTLVDKHIAKPYTCLN